LYRSGNRDEQTNDEIKIMKALKAYRELQHGIQTILGYSVSEARQHIICELRFRRMRKA
jgi:hypothetical protein